MHDAFGDLTNLELWERLRTVDRQFTKPITGKSYKGDSPNPTWMIMKATEQLGPIGGRWGFTVQWDRVRQGKPHQVIVEQITEMHPLPADAGPDAQPRAKSKTVRYELIREEYHEICIRFWFMHDDGKLGSYDAIGGTPMLYMTKSGNWMHDEDAAKKSLTDAYTKGLSWLGVAADIFLGIYDSKYGDGSQPPDDDIPPDNGNVNNQAAQTKAQSGQRNNSTPEGW